MARQGGGEALVLGVLAGAGAAFVYVYLTRGRGSDNARLIPDALEDRIDHLVASLNRAFGPRWVTRGLDSLEASIERTMPTLAWLVDAVHHVEEAHAGKAGAAKKKAAMRRARGKLLIE